MQPRGNGFYGRRQFLRVGGAGRARIVLRRVVLWRIGLRRVAARGGRSLGSEHRIDGLRCSSRGGGQRGRCGGRRGHVTTRLAATFDER